MQCSDEVTPAVRKHAWLLHTNLAPSMTPTYCPLTDPVVDRVRESFHSALCEVALACDVKHLVRQAARMEQRWSRTMLFAGEQRTSSGGGGGEDACKSQVQCVEPEDALVFRLVFANLPRACQDPLKQRPHVTIPLVEYSLSLLLWKKYNAVVETAQEAAAAASSDTFAYLPFCRLAVVGCPLVSVDALGSHLLNTLVRVRGVVVRLGVPRLQCLKMVYRCGKCKRSVGANDGDASGDSMRVSMASCGVVEAPSTVCEGCSGNSWIPVAEKAACEEVQHMRINASVDIPTGGSAKAASGQRTLEVELRHHLIDGARPGDYISLCGIVESRVDKPGASTQTITLRAIAIEPHAEAMEEGAAATGGSYKKRQRARGDQGNDHADDERGKRAGEAEISIDTQSSPARRVLLSDVEMYVREPGWFDLLVKSVCTSICGRFTAKQAILLTLLGCSAKGRRGGGAASGGGSSAACGGGGGGGSGAAPMRTSLHTLMIGEPGVGKSQLLRAACEIAPRSVFVTANSSSTCGITVSVSRDSHTGASSFEAGAVMHGEDGVTCIDEIDKGQQDHKALLEIMEQETISVAKAGMVMQIPVSTSILAAGNAVGGQFNYSRTVMENINMTPALLSRFDIIVILDRELIERDDHGVVQHVLKYHNGDHSSSRHSNAKRAKPQRKDTNKSRKKNDSAEGVVVLPEILPQSFITQFIDYARSLCFPRLSSEAAAVLKQEYLSERQAQQSNIDTGTGADWPVTPRLLNSMIRVSQAKARCDLRSTVSPEDALFAAELIRKCRQGGAVPQGGGGRSDGAGSLFAATTGDGVTRRARKLSPVEQVKQALAQLIRTKEVNGSEDALVSYNEIIEVCEDVGVSNAMTMVQRLNDNGIILQQSAQRYKLLKN